MNSLKNCNLCPRSCHANRLNLQTGFCGESSQLKVAGAHLHQWEEPCLSGTCGSGTVFFCGCTLRCVYCQNQKIASGQTGTVISIQRLVEIFFLLNDMGAHNINLVTPTHFVPQIAQALELAKGQGLKLPVVYNTSSYETTDTLKRLDGLVDIYLPDLKYVSSDLSLRYSHAADYFDCACKAIAEMVRQVGEPVFDNGTVPLMKKGVIVRHLVLPGCVRDSRCVVEYLYRTYGNRVYISILNQFTPFDWLEGFEELNRKVTQREYASVVDYAIELGVENGFIQEGNTALQGFVPDFENLLI